jgi:hypothetical protein
MRLLKLGLAAWSVAASALAADAPTVTRYFGEPLPGLSASDAVAFERGARLFARSWERERSGVANAPSCVACHSVPTPGGSGMADRALVSIDTQAAAGEREEILQRSIAHDTAGDLRRTPGLYGVGFLEAVEPKAGIGPFRMGAHNVQPSLREFVSTAFATELGVSTSRHCARRRVADAYPTRCTAGIPDGDIDDVVTFETWRRRPDLRASQNRRRKSSPGSGAHHATSRL